MDLHIKSTCFSVMDPENGRVNTRPTIDFSLRKISRPVTKPFDHEWLQVNGGMV